jgi:hypothetical protein
MTYFPEYSKPSLLAQLEIAYSANTTMSTPKPLWRAMAAASVQAVFDSANADQPVVNCRIAAELRTIAKNIPEELYGAGGVRRWLCEEADRAERGE